VTPPRLPAAASFSRSTPMLVIVSGSKKGTVGCGTPRSCSTTSMCCSLQRRSSWSGRGPPVRWAACFFNTSPASTGVSSQTHDGLVQDPSEGGTVMPERQNLKPRNSCRILGGGIPPRSAGGRYRCCRFFV